MAFNVESFLQFSDHFYLKSIDYNITHYSIIRIIYDSH